MCLVYSFEITTGKGTYIETTMHVIEVPFDPSSQPERISIAQKFVLKLLCSNFFWLTLYATRIWLNILLWFLCGKMIQNFRKSSLSFNEFFIGSHFTDLAIFENNNLVNFLEIGNAVGNQKPEINKKNQFTKLKVQKYQNMLTLESRYLQIREGDVLVSRI